MSPAGLQTYLEGAKGLCGLGRGKDLVFSYLQEMPLVAKECARIDTLFSKDLLTSVRLSLLL